MKRVRLIQPGDIQVEDATAPVNPQAGEALVQFRCGGICGSDLAAYRGVSPLVQYPTVLGHELVVDVLECPDRPELVGQRAVVEPLMACGQCRSCRRGRYNCCVDLRVMGVHIDGGLQERTLVDSRRLYRIPTKLADETAVLAEPTSIAYRAVQRSQIEAGQIAVVIGAGTIGILIAHLLIRARGCRTFVIDIDAARLQLAQSIGAIPLAGEAPDVIRQLEEATAGELADVVFEATGHPACTRMTTDLVGYVGRIVLIGWNQGPVDIDTVTLMKKEADLVGSRNSTNAFPAVLRLLEDGIVDSNVLITHRFPLSEVGNALAMLDRGEEQALKVLIEG